MRPAARCLIGIPALLLAAACSAGPALSPATPLDDRLPVAVLPFQAVAAGVEEVRLSHDALVNGLRATGRYRVLPEAQIEEALTERRIRVVESLPPKVVSDLSQSLGRPFLVCGTTLQTAETPEPSVSMLIRVYDPAGRRLGSLLWSLRGSEAADAFGLGAPEDVSMLWEKHAGDWLKRVEELISARPHAPRQRIAVLPFTPGPKHSESGRLAALIAAHLLEQEFGVEVVEPGDLTGAFVRSRVRSLEYFGTEDAAKLAEQVGTRWLLAGAVMEMDYGNGPSFPPKVSLTLRFFDAKAGHSVASSLQSRTGTDGEIVFGIGQAFHPVTNLALALRDGLEQLDKPWATP